MTRTRAKKPATEAAEGKKGSATSPKEVAKRLNRDKRNQDLAMEIDGLRASLTEMVNSYRFKVDAGLVQLGAAARGESMPGDSSRKLPASVAARMLQRIRELKLKSKKGRAKDFQRLQDLVDELSEMLPVEK